MAVHLSAVIVSTVHNILKEDVSPWVAGGLGSQQLLSKRFL